MVRVHTDPRITVPAAVLLTAAAMVAPVRMEAQASGGPAPLLAQAGGEGMVLIPAGEFISLYGDLEAPVEMAAFRLDRTPVTRRAYLEFVRARPEWRRGRVAAVFAEGGYVADWAAPLDPIPLGESDPAWLDTPVTRVSWFAASAYCSWRGARLPTTEEWEYAAAATDTDRDTFRDPAAHQWLLAQTSVGQREGPRTVAREAGGPRTVGSTFRNAYGLWDMVGLVSEWVSDFNSFALGAEARGNGGVDRDLFCAAGSLDATDRGNHLGFLRYAFRSGLEGDDTIPTLGFRCAGGA